MCIEDPDMPNAKKSREVIRELRDELPEWAQELLKALPTEDDISRRSRDTQRMIAKLRCMSCRRRGVAGTIRYHENTKVFTCTCGAKDIVLASGENTR